MEHIYNDSNNIIQCKPLYKVKKDNLIIGILTISNQFVMLNKPEMYINDELEEISQENNLFTDNIIQNQYTIDENRIKIIKNIKLESNFYNSFNYKIIIQDIINNNALIYFDKLKLIYEQLVSLSKNYIIFAEYDTNILNNIKNISLCINNNNCDTDFCMKNKELNICNLIIPKNNLITNDNNYDIYFTKLSDEFVRYNKTKLILFDKLKFLSFNNIKYNINNDELVIMETMLIKKIFTNNFDVKNSFVNYNTYDTHNIN